jgi:molecular chaperone DnaK (HSP70)
LLARPQDASDSNLVVVDFGAGKLDLSLVRKERRTLTMLRTAGDTRFGGMDLDCAIADAIAGDIPPEARVSRRQILSECRRCRELLSSESEATLSLGGYSRVLTSHDLTVMVGRCYEKVTRGLNDLFENGAITRESVQEVHIAGGLSRDPMVVNLIKTYFSGSTAVTHAADTAVVIGAAMEGAILKGGSGSLLPKLKVRLTTPLSLGFSLADGTCSILIPRGSILPAKKCTTTTTSRDNQRNVGFDVVEGERAMVNDNVKLGNVVVHGIERASRGVPKIQITMEINEDGILVVTAIDTKTGAAITATIQSGSNLSREEIARMIAEAHANKAEDDRLHKRTEWRTRLTSYVNRLSQREISDERAREELLERVSEWKEWNDEHANEEAADAFIQQYFAVRKAAKQILGQPCSV